MDYLNHFNLADQPFKSTYNGKFFYRSAAVGEIFQYLSLEDRPALIHIKGQARVGKTFLMRRLVPELKEAGRTALVLNPHLTLAEILRQVLIDFGHSHKLSARTQEEELLGYFQNAASDFLEDGQRVFLAVDNAAELPPAMLAELYRLMELEPGWRGRVSLVLCGPEGQPWPMVPDQMPEIKELILPPLSPAETEDYVSARLKAAGAGSLFSRAALKILATHGQGRPDTINQLAERGLIAAWSAGRAEVGPAQMETAQASLAAPQNLDYDRLAAAARGQVIRPDPPARPRTGIRRLRFILPALFLALAWGYFSHREEPPPPPVPSAAAEVQPPRPVETAVPAGEAQASGVRAPSLPAPPAQLLTLPQGAWALVVDQDLNTGRLWQGRAQGPGLKAEVAVPDFSNPGLFLFGRPRGQRPLIFQYPPARDLPVAEAQAIWPKVSTLLPQNILPVIAAPAQTLSAPGRPEDLAAIDNRFKAWVQSQQYKFPDTTAALYASSFQFFELGQPPRSLNREDFRRALNSEARTSGEVLLTTSQPLIMRDPKNDRLAWVLFNLKYESRLRHDMGFRVLIFEKTLIGGPDGWLIAAELWLPENSLRGN